MIEPVIGSMVIIRTDALKRTWKVKHITIFIKPARCLLYSTDPDNEKCRRSILKSELLKE